MIFQNSLGNYLGKRALNKFQAKQPRKILAKNLQQIKSAVILGQYQPEISFNQALNQQKLLKQIGVKKVNTLVFIPLKTWKKQISNLQNHPVTFITEKDFWYNFSPKLNELSNLINQPTDVFIDLTETENLFCLYTLAYSQSQLKIGRNLGSKTQYLDFLITHTPKTKNTNLNQNIIDYLKLLNKAA